MKNGITHPIFSKKSFIESFVQLPDNFNLPGKKQTEPGVAFITGATGFIGGSLLKELLLNNCFEKYVCLVRAENKQNAFDRIKINLLEKGTPKQLVDDKLIQVEIGDIMHPKLGLSDTTWNTIASEANHVFHFAATMNWVTPFNARTIQNIEAVQTIIELCSTEHVKHLHYASSMGLWTLLHHSSDTIMEDELHSSGEQLPGGYFQSKWISEGILRMAKEAEIPTNVYRIGDVKGDSESGQGDPQNFGNLFMQYFLQKGMAIDSSKPLLNFIPVDYLAKAITTIVKSEHHGTFQFSNPELISFRDIYEQARAAGHSIELTNMETWLSMIKNDTLENAKLLRPIFRSFVPGPGYDSTSFYKIGIDMFQKKHDTKNTDQALEGSAVKCPSMISTGILQKYLNHLGETIAH